MNQKFKATFGNAPPDLPLRDGGHIVTGNALRIDWLCICPQTKDDAVETYICGNPPYKGSSNQTAEEKRDLAHVFSPHTKNFKNLDFVTAWYIKSCEFNMIAKADSAFVATNSICQGDSVRMLWAHVYEHNMEINFAHLSFKWKNLAKRNAGVTCIIVGISRVSKEVKLLIDAKKQIRVSNINPYLLNLPNIIIQKKSVSISDLPEMVWGNKPTDGGHLILDENELDNFLEAYPQGREFIKSYSGSQEFIKGIKRWCLWLEDKNSELAQQIPFIRDRVQKVEAFRLESTAASTRQHAQWPHKFRQIQGWGNSSLLIPSVSSERRQYFPVGFLDEKFIVNNSAYAIYNPPVYVFSILSSRLHLMWIDAVGGKMENRYRYTNTLIYNTFPAPDLSQTEKQALEEHAWHIIEAREAHPGKTIAWLYNPDTMPDNLLAAHRSLDDTFERIYIGRPFENDTERLEHLFKLYAKMTKQKAA